MRYINRLVFVVLLLTLAGCHYLTDNKTLQIRDREYLEAKSIPPLTIPPGLSSSTVQAEYPVSEKNDSESSKEVSLLPPGLNK